MAGAAAKKGDPVDLAIVFGGGKGGGGPRKPPARSMSEPEGDEMMGAEGDGDGDEMGGEFSTAADEFLDDTLDPEARKAALKRAIQACMGEEY